MTKEYAIENHRRLWQWIHDETLRRKQIVRKYDYFIEFNLPHVFLDCYLCDYTNQECSLCPLCWPDSKGNCTICSNSYYGLCYHLSNTNNYRLYAKIAQRIADLPVKGD